MYNSIAGSKLKTEQLERKIIERNHLQMQVFQSVPIFVRLSKNK